MSLSTWASHSGSMASTLFLVCLRTIFTLWCLMLCRVVAASSSSSNSSSFSGGKRHTEAPKFGAIFGCSDLLRLYLTPVRVILLTQSCDSLGGCGCVYMDHGIFTSMASSESSSMSSADLATRMLLYLPAVQPPPSLPPDTPDTAGPALLLDMSPPSLPPSPSSSTMVPSPTSMSSSSASSFLSWSCSVVLAAVAAAAAAATAVEAFVSPAVAATAAPPA
mmetsp:Transcript_38018/g.94293  ORF Transcript_38018/g.94293 Transcript_38018/m.94293 type:complete len:220 (-) Transcript_38018:242-901(-)